MRMYKLLFCVLIKHTHLLLGHPYDYDVFVIGAGASGTVATKTAALASGRVGLVYEPESTQMHLQKSNLPIQSFIHAAKIADTIRNSANFGITISDPTISAHGVFSYIKNVVNQALESYQSHYANNQNIHIFHGKAFFIDNHTLLIGQKSVTSDKFIIATGGNPHVPVIEGIESVPYLTEETLFSLEALPESILVVGEGPLALELTTALHRFGVHVTLITPHGLILPKYDFELVHELQQIMKAAGIKIKYHMSIDKIEVADNLITTHCHTHLNEHKSYTAQNILFAFTRSGRIEGMNLEKLGIKFTPGGVKVNKYMQTCVPNIFACGNAVGQMRTLSRVSYYQAQIAAYNATKYSWQRKIAADYSNASSFIQGISPIGAVGLTEQEARKIYGKNVKIYRFNYSSLVKAHIEKTTEGMTKFICDTSGRLLGVHVLGAAADTIIDNVRIGESFSGQFKDYLIQLRTSPNYLDLVWAASKQSESDAHHTVFNALFSFIKNLF